MSEEVHDGLTKAASGALANVRKLGESLGARAWGAYLDARKKAHTPGQPTAQSPGKGPARLLAGVGTARAAAKAGRRTPKTTPTQQQPTTPTVTIAATMGQGQGPGLGRGLTL